MNKVKPFWKKSFYCGEIGGCEKCRVCNYVNFLDWARSVAPSGSTIEYDAVIDAFLEHQLPAWEKQVEKFKKEEAEYLASLHIHPEAND